MVGARQGKEELSTKTPYEPYGGWLKSPKQNPPCCMTGWLVRDGVPKAACPSLTPRNPFAYWALDNLVSPEPVVLMFKINPNSQC